MRIIFFLSLYLTSALVFANTNVEELISAVEGASTAPTPLDKESGKKVYELYMTRLTPEQQSKACSLFTKERISETLVKLVQSKKFLEIPIPWYVRVYENLQACKEVRTENHDILLRKLAFSVLLYGEDARSLYTKGAKRIEADPNDAQAYVPGAEQAAAMTLGAEGKTQEYESALRAITQKKYKNPENGQGAKNWSLMLLAQSRLDHGDLKNSEHYLKLISQEYLKRDPDLAKHVQSIGVQKKVFRYVSERQKVVPQLPECAADSKKDNFDYVMVEVCLVAQAILNKKVSGENVELLQNSLLHLYPIQKAQLLAELVLLQNYGAVLKPNYATRVKDLLIQGTSQTMFRHYLTFASDIKNNKSPDAVKALLAKTGDFSLSGLLFHYNK